MGTSDRPKVVEMPGRQVPWPAVNIDDCPTDPSAAIPYLRAKEFSKIQSMTVLVTRLGLPLSDAKLLVHNSEAWADRKAADEQFIDELLEQLGVSRDEPGA